MKSLTMTRLDQIVPTGTKPKWEVTLTNDQWYDFYGHYQQFLRRLSGKWTKVHHMNTTDFHPKTEDLYRLAEAFRLGWAYSLTAQAEAWKKSGGEMGFPIP